MNARALALAAALAALPLHAQFHRLEAVAPLRSEAPTGTT
jgi:hypothetical protein